MTKQVATGKIFVTAFLDFRTYKRFFKTVAWETKVWTSEMLETVRNSSTTAGKLLSETSSKKRRGNRTTSCFPGKKMCCLYWQRILRGYCKSNVSVWLMLVAFSVSAMTRTWIFPAT